MDGVKEERVEWAIKGGRIGVGWGRIGLAESGSMCAGVYTLCILS